MNCEGCLNKGDCEGCEEVPREDPYFHVGDIIPLKGRLFRVKSVKPKEIRLKLWRKTTCTEKGAIR
jgi:uncharacterized Zn finger protein